MEQHIKDSGGYEAVVVEDGVRNLAVDPATRAVIRTDDVYQTEVEKGVAGYPQRAVDIAAGYSNAGRIEDASAIGMAGRSKRGENSCQIFMKVDDASGRITHATFRARGSLGTIASASVAATLCEGLTLPEALAQVTDARIHEELGGELPRGGAMGPLIAAEAVRAAVGDYHYRAGADLARLDELCPCDSFSRGCLMCIKCSLRETRAELLVARAKAAKAANAAKATPGATPAPKAEAATARA